MFRHNLEKPSPPPRVVILGSSGFVGSYLQSELAARKIEVLGLCSKQLDLTAPGAAQQLAQLLRKNDTLIFASCITRDKGDDLPTFVRNIKMAEQVGICIESNPCAHLIYLSSDAVYKDGISPLREDSESGPAGLYPMAQFARETLMSHSTGKAKIPLAILRLCAVYGKGDSHNGYGPNRFARTAAEQAKINLFGEGEETRDHIYVKDACGIIAMCATHRTSGVLNVATGKSLSFMSVAKAVARVWDKPVVIEGSPRKSPITHRHFDNSLLIKAFPAFTFTPIEQGLRETFCL
jgi:UDP-glucose 4-epimerase